jgi:hypothetical protein
LLAEGATQKKTTEKCVSLGTKRNYAVRKSNSSHP